MPNNGCISLTSRTLTLHYVVTLMPQKSLNFFNFIMKGPVSLWTRGPNKLQPLSATISIDFHLREIKCRTPDKRIFENFCCLMHVDTISVQSWRHMPISSQLITGTEDETINATLDHHNYVIPGVPQLTSSAGFWPAFLLNFRMLPELKMTFFAMPFAVPFPFACIVCFTEFPVKKNFKVSVKKFPGCVKKLFKDFSRLAEFFRIFKRWMSVTSVGWGMMSSRVFLI